MHKVSELITKISNNELEEKFREIYITDEIVSKQKERYLSALNHYLTKYGDEEVKIVSAPGRSEICGNHTDHQLGKVLACAVNMDIIAIISPQENIINVASDSYTLNPVDITDLAKKEKESGTSEGLIRGVAARLKELGYEIGGFNAYTDSTVLEGSGLSSSAAFETLIGTIISALYNNGEIDPVVIAQVGQYAENHYFDKPCGLMDQCATSVGGMIYIDFKDVTNPEVHKIEIDFNKFDHSLCIVDVHASHADLTPDYAAVPEEMKQVASALNEDVLRYVDEEDFYNQIAKLRTNLSDRSILRAIHLFEENKRVSKAVESLEKEDFASFKQAIKASGNSSFKYLQNIYSPRDVDHQAVSIALAVSDVILGDNGVSRVHGGGFAGTTQAFVHNDFVNRYKEMMESIFGLGSCHVLKIRPVGGVEII